MQKWQVNPMESNRRLSHQTSNGDSHCINHKEHQDAPNNHSHVLQQHLNHTHNDTLQKRAEQNFVCGLRREVLKPTLVMCAWFFCSFMTIMLNKYILSSLDTDPGILGEFQIVITTILGFIAMYMPCHILKKTNEKHSTESYNKVAFFRSMAILGFLRFFLLPVDSFIFKC